MDYYGINPIERFDGTSTYITLKNHHPWGCQVYVLDVILKVNISKIPKREPRSCVGIYICHSPVHVGSVAMVNNPAIGHVYPKFHGVFDDELPQFQLLGEAQYTQIGQMLCNASHKVLHQIILTSSKVVLLQLLKKIPAKIQLTC